MSTKDFWPCLYSLTYFSTLLIGSSCLFLEVETLCFLFKALCSAVFTSLFLLLRTVSGTNWVSVVVALEVRVRERERMERCYGASDSMFLWSVNNSRERLILILFRERFLSLNSLNQNPLIENVKEWLFRFKSIKFSGIIYVNFSNNCNVIWKKNSLLGLMISLPSLAKIFFLLSLWEKRKGTFVGFFWLERCKFSC